MPESHLASTRTVHTVALAYFSHRNSVSDSVRDLCTAGFKATDINISFPLAQQASDPAADKEVLPDAIGTHSLRWLWSRARAHDRHRSGAEQLGGRNPVPFEGANPTCFTLDLHAALTAMSVPSEVIALLQKDVQHKGMFMLVDAANRVDEAGCIMDANSGYIRTQYLRA